MRVAAIVPARNEAAHIADTVRALLDVTSIDEVIVVDDASGDGTGERAAAAGARAFRLGRRAGKGGALRFGLGQTDAAIVAFIDGDLGSSARIAAALVRPVLDGDADMTIAQPPANGPSGFGLVEGFSRWGIRRLVGLEMARPLSGQRALRREIIDRSGPAAGFGVEVALTVDAARAGYRIVEIPLALEHARTGRDVRGFVHRARQGFDVAAVLASRAGWKR